jgi:hypothetical protein
MADASGADAECAAVDDCAAGVAASIGAAGIGAERLAVCGASSPPAIEFAV